MDEKKETVVETEVKTENKQKKTGKSLNPFKNKKFKYGSLSVLFTVIFIVFVVLINVVITLLGERFFVAADLTDEGLYSIEQSTVDYLSGITDEVTITVTSEEGDFSGAGSYFYQTNEILKRIANSSDKITLNYIDIVANPGFQSGYTQTISADQIVVESKATGPSRAKVLAYDDYLSIKYNEQYLMYGMTQIESVEANCEQAVVSAIMNVTDVDPVKVAVLTGYGETKNPVVEQLLETNSYIVESVNITLSASISDEYDFVFIFGPTSDYSVADVTKLDDWLDNKGIFEKNLIYVSNPALGESPNLDGLLEDWGMAVQKGTVYQTDGNYAATEMPTYQYLQVPDSEFSELASDAPVLTNNMSAINMLWSDHNNAQSNLESQVLLATYNGAVVKPQNSGDNWKPDDSMAKSSLPVAVQTTKTRFEGVDPFISRVITIGGMEMFGTLYMTSATNNAEFMMNIFNVCSGKEEGLTLTPKSYDTVPLEITEAQKNTMVVIFVAVLPLVIIIAGIIIWIRRIHK
ncbi:MAG: GldG family protein [Eubacterium sp.]|nr:GldG family protein [Eubacterium sp.]